MNSIAAPELVLSFEAHALERCFLVADILRDVYKKAPLEYALLGLAAEDDPLCVLATPLLPGQRVSAAEVEQSGHAVLEMRAEIEEISALLQKRLVPISFVHRHRTYCDASLTDYTFLAGPFIDQVSTLLVFDDPGSAAVESRSCTCTDGELGIAFSLIVNGVRDHRLYAARKQICSCGRGGVRCTTARLAVRGSADVSEPERGRIRDSLVAEIEEKIDFDGDACPGKEMQRC